MAEHFSLEKRGGGLGRIQLWFLSVQRKVDDKGCSYQRKEDMAIFKS